MQKETLGVGVGGRGSDKLYAIKTPQSLDPGKAQQRDAAVPHQECRDVSYSEVTWSQDTHGRFSGIHRRQRWRGLNTRIILCYFSWATRDLELLVCGLLYCILYMYIYVQVWYNFGERSWRVSHGRHRHWVKDSISPSNMLSHSSFCYFFPLNFHHAPILFPSSQELFEFYIHTPLEGLDPTVADSREDKAKRHLEIKIQQTSKSFMLFDDWIKYSKQLVKYIQNPTPSLYETHAKPHVDRKTEHIRVG